MSDQENTEGDLQTVKGLVQTIKLASIDEGIDLNLEKARSTLEGLARLITVQAKLLTEIVKSDKVNKKTLEMVSSEYEKLLTIYPEKLTNFQEVCLKQIESQLSEKERTAELLKNLK